MQNKSITRKIPGGKLVRMDVTFSDHIEDVVITGDFFLYPEDALDELIKVIRGKSLPINAAELTRELNQTLETNDAQFLGVSVNDLVSLLQEVLA